MDILIIKKVDKESSLRNMLIEFVMNFSWIDVKEHMLKELRNWTFTDWETPFVAIINEQIVGTTFIRKKDYYPLPEIYPWISGVFVSENYRGNRISEKLINYANDYAKVNGFNKTYIPSIHIGLYEKYGYHYLRDIVNYGGGIDKLYFKEI